MWKTKVGTGKFLLVFALISGWPHIRLELRRATFEFPFKIQSAFAGRQVFNTVGITTNFLIDTGTTMVTVKAWGAGGGGGANSPEPEPAH